MKTASVKLLALAGMIFLLGACKKDKPEDTGNNGNDGNTGPQANISITMMPTFDGEPVKLDSICYAPGNYRVKFTRISFYATNWKADGQTLFDVALFDYGTTGYKLADFYYPGGMQIADAEITGNIGVDDTRNHADPSAFPNSSPLNILNAGGLHWGWNPGYVFIAIEGKADTTGTLAGPFDQNFTFHVGLDENLGSFNWNGLTNELVQIDDDPILIPLRLNMKDVLFKPGNAVELKTENFTHSGAAQSALTQKIRDNFINAIYNH